jgi:hypothetical protein
MDANSCDTALPRQTRKIKPTRRSVSGVYPFRGETAIPIESTLERDFLILLSKWEQCRILIIHRVAPVTWER